MSLPSSSSPSPTLDLYLQSHSFPFPDHKSTTLESPHVQSIIKTLNLQPHIEGGYFVETDRDERLVPNPFATNSGNPDETRAASTSIFYMITSKTPIGYFHRNKGRTVHTLHEGRGRYVLITAPSGVEAYVEGEADGANSGKWTVETFVVGKDVAAGERLQWIVEGGVWKSSFLLESGEGEEGCLISETVVPGFEYTDHEFLERKRLDELVGAKAAKELDWLVRKV